MITRAIGGLGNLEDAKICHAIDNNALLLDSSAPEHKLSCDAITDLRVSQMS